MMATQTDRFGTTNSSADLTALRLALLGKALDSLPGATRRAGEGGGEGEAGAPLRRRLGGVAASQRGPSAQGFTLMRLLLAPRGLNVID